MPSGPRRREIADLPGVRLGHAQDPELPTGVSVLRFDHPVPTVLDLRGGASATYDTGSLALDATFGRRWAIFFAGGSVYGLDAARGVRTRILEEGEGHRAFGNPSRIVPITGAALFDLPPGGGAVADYLPLGYEAARRAARGSSPQGRVGAGAGATVGKYRSRALAMHGGLGTAAARVAGLGYVGALVVANSAGAIRDPATSRWVAGARRAGGGIHPPVAGAPRAANHSHTTLAAIVTELRLDRPRLQRIAALVSAGLARAIVPFHTSLDGDMVFAASTERLSPRRAESSPGEFADRIGTRAAELAVAALLSGVRAGNRSG